MNRTSSTALNIFLPQDWQTRLDRTLDSTMFGPISEQSSANVLPSRFAWPEDLNKFSVEMYLVLFLKLPNFILLTPHNLHKSLVFSSWRFVSPFAMHASTTKCKTIAFTPLFRAKIVGSNWLVQLIGVSWGQRGDNSERHSKNPSSLANDISRGFAARD